MKKENAKLEPFLHYIDSESYQGGEDGMTGGGDD